MNNSNFPHNGLGVEEHPYPSAVETSPPVDRNWAPSTVI